MNRSNNLISILKRKEKIEYLKIKFSECYESTESIMLLDWIQELENEIKQLETQ